MLAWACDLIVASDDARVLRSGRDDGRVRRRMVRASLGTRAAQGQGTAVHRRYLERRRRRIGSAWSTTSCRPPN